ncbi:MAG: glycosyltransferase family protein [Candidatus Acidiferrales bacterium]
MDCATPSPGKAAQVRDAIVVSGWSWETFNVPERVALALARLGSKVLYCENPVSLLRRRGRPLEAIKSGVHRFGPKFFGHRLNMIPLGFSQLQAAMVARQILRNASKLNLKEPLFIYPHGEFLVPLCREFKRRDFFLVHVCMDYPERGQKKHIQLSDMTLVIPKSVFHKLKSKYGDKIASVPQVTASFEPGCQNCANTSAPKEFAAIPRPRLGYIGPVADRLNLKVLDKMLRARPDWHFVHFGETKCLPLPNVHVIAWRAPEKLADVIANLDVGLMPYDCYSNKNFHCMPLKVFDYFYAGLPVVSTPIVNLWEYPETIYFGDDAEELCRAVQLALDEPADSPKKSARIAIAEEHSIEGLAASLADLLSAKRL